MDKYDFIRNVKGILDNFNDEEIINRQQEIKSLLVQIVDLECEYAKAGVRTLNDEHISETI